MPTTSIATRALGLSVGCTSLLIQPVRAFTRYIGDPHDPLMSAISAECNGTSQSNFQRGRCPALLRCVLDNTPADLLAGMQSGGNIASLVPTILALIGAPPLDLVQLALLSPHRALATCCCSIGLPSGLFRQLKPLTRGLAEKREDEPKVREWVFQMPTSSSTNRHSGWRIACTRMLVDVIILGLASVILWYNWKINTEIMITWRCEYGWLLFAWPLACMSWLLVAMCLLWAMKASFEILYFTDPDREPTKLQITQLMALPYQTRQAQPELQVDPEHLLEHTEGTKGTSIIESAPSVHPGIIPKHLDTAHTSEAAPISSMIDGRTSVPAYSRETMAQVVKIRITMSAEHGLRSWRWYETLLETMAVGIYLYATFVLTSTLFMSGETALNFATAMTVTVSAIRILGSLF